MARIWWRLGRILVLSPSTEIHEKSRDGNVAAFWWKFLARKMLGTLIPSDEIVEAERFSAEEIEGAADGDVHVALREAVDGFQVGKGGSAAGVGERAVRPAAEKTHELGVDALAESFDVGGVDEEFGAEGGELIEGLVVELEVGERLPAVHGNDPAVLGAAAGEVDHEFFGRYEMGEFFETLREKFAGFVEKSGRDDNV